VFAALAQRSCEGCARLLHFASDDLALLNLDSVPSMCRHRSPSLPIADRVHHNLNDGRKPSLDDTCGDRLAVGECDESDVACRRATRLIVDSLQGNRNPHSICAKTNKSLNLLRGITDYALADLQPESRRFCLLLRMEREMQQSEEYRDSQ
jgi:hypothetical protein